MHININNLPYDITEKKLEMMFSEFGEVTSVLIWLTTSGAVKMPNDWEATAAIKALNNSFHDGRRIMVRENTGKVFFG